MGARQLELPIVEISNALVQVVPVGRSGRPRVRPLDYDGWVKFPRELRELGAIYLVERLSPRPGGAWTAAGEIRRVK